LLQNDLAFWSETVALIKNGEAASSCPGCKNVFLSISKENKQIAKVFEKQFNLEQD